jgi:ABC-2 type transport system ATP-binding protein
VRFRLPAGVEPFEVAALLDGGTRLDCGSSEVVVTTPTPTATLHTLTSWALDRGQELEGLAVQRPSLEDLFLTLAGDSDD